MTNTMKECSQLATARNRWSWGSVGSACTFLAICGFVLAATWAKFNPVQAGEDKKVQTPKVKSADKTTKKKAKVQESTRPIPGAGEKLDAQALAKIIDQEVQLRLRAEGLKASPLASDTEFLRRVYLDLVGVIPTPEKVKAFLESKDPDKRSKVIDELLADPRFGNSLAEVWTGQMLPRESNNRVLNRTPLQRWLAANFNNGKSLDKLVYELLTATGTQDENGAVTYFVGNPTVDKITDNVTKMFLGVQLQCAQCHNHPFTDWKQTEYWGMAAFFMKVRLTANPQQAAKKGVSPGIVEGAAPKGGKKKGGLPESAKIVPAKFLQAEQPKMDPSGPARPTLAKWATSPSNPFFARAMVNRAWYQLFGRGLVNPVDDMHQENPASHMELLAALTEQLKSSDFDLKYLYRAICNSQAYQRTSRPFGDNTADTELYSHRVVRVLTPEQLFDSLGTVVGTQATKVDKKGPKAAKKGPVGPRENFLAFFRIDEGADPLEYQAGIPQALRLMNSPLLNNASALNRAMEEGKSPPQVIERLYLVVLSRMPTEQETERMIRHVQAAGDPRTGYSDVLWALLNSSEFAMNH